MLNRRTVMKGTLALGVSSLLPVPAWANMEISLVASAPVFRPDLGFMFLAGPAGFDEQLGVDVDPVTIGGASAALQLLASGGADVAHTGMLDLLVAKAANPNLPVKAIFLQDWKSGYEIVVPEDGPIQSLEELAGSSIGVANLASGAIPFAQAMLRNAGVDPDTVELLPVGVGAQALTALRGGEVQALSLFRGTHAAIENLGVRFRYFTEALPSNCYVVHTRVLETKPEAVIAFLQGVILSTVYLRANPEQSVRYFWELFGKPAGDEDQALRDGVHLINRAAEMWRPEDATLPWGHMDENTWQDLVDFVGDADGVDLSGLDLSVIYTDELVAPANEVDTSIALRKAEADRVN